MKHLLITLGIALLTAPQAASAYLSPTEVFTDLEIPEQAEVPDAAVSAPAPEPEPEPIPEPNVEEVMPEKILEVPENLDTFGTTTSGDEEEKVEEESSPTFFRSGKVLEHESEMPPEPSDTLDVFDLEAEQNTDIEPEPQIIEEEPIVDNAPEQPEETVQEEPEVAEEVLEPEVTSEEEVSDSESEQEPVQPAASGTSLFIRLLKSAQYYIIGLAILMAGGLYFYIGKRKPVSVPSPVNTSPEQTASQPEDSSPRLEQALKAMEQEGIQAAGDRLKEMQQQPQVPDQDATPQE